MIGDECDCEKYFISKDKLCLNNSHMKCRIFLENVVEKN